MGTNNQSFEFHQRPLHSAKGLIGTPVYFFQDKTRRLCSYWDASTFIYVDIFWLQASIQQTSFQQHGVTSHTAWLSYDIIGRLFWVRIISWNANIAWALRSRDLSVCDYIFWRHLKNAVYQINPPNLIPYPAHGSDRNKHRQHLEDTLRCAMLLHNRLTECLGQNWQQLSDVIVKNYFHFWTKYV